MDIKSISHNEISKPAVSENKFDPDKRVDTERNRDTSGDTGYDVDRRVETYDKIGTSSDERKAFANYSDGEWSGEPGNSMFKPNSETAKEKLSEYEQEGIEYKDGNPDFSKCSEATVEIDNMTSTRASNFRQADIACSEVWNAELKDGRNDWSPQEVKTWRQENYYSWHERVDMKTMDLVQRDIHEECKHYGGVSECKRFEAINGLGGEFDD